MKAWPAENMVLPDSMITWFDLIYNLRDIPDAKADGLIGKHLLTGGTPGVLSRKEITVYIEMVRSLKPVMTPDVVDAIRKYYIGARSASGEIRITPRQLEAVKRLAGARAKIYRRKEVTIQDATRAIFLVENMIQRTLVDPATGQPDHLLATSGKSRSAVRLADEAIVNMEGEFTAADLVDELKMSFADIERALDRLHRSGMLLEGSPGVYRRV